MAVPEVVRTAKCRRMCNAPYPFLMPDIREGSEKRTGDHRSNGATTPNRVAVSGAWRHTHSN